MGVPVVLEGVTHEYHEASDQAFVSALADVTLVIADGDFAILMGASGSGKSTLLNVIGAVDQPTRGRVVVGTEEISSLHERDLTMFRRRRVGFIFQFFNLIPTLTVEENVAFPLSLSGVSRSETRSRVGAVLDEVGLTSRRTHFPNQLSGGEMQRVAIGRAIVHRPPLLLADEPTGNLDSKTGAMILGLIQEIHRAYKPTIILATHSDRAAAIGHYMIRVVDGRVEATG
ncbi:MAG TPA: ABC transporter ATP-binding protein [Thermoanaerobaculia bacterium]|nr:ABC transporter ATP-binding protein [Thermoanaerobaculia bacterium]